ncbi:DUF4189 domain-containing protein [Mycolicibacterium sp.]|uniref:DUF4189 domain-containing protein n=1 Tax=Mycolicibacterium sp. TaxID=2320850 RepID=UPI0037C6245E
MKLNVFDRRGAAVAVAGAAVVASVISAPTSNAAIYYGAIAYAPNGAWGSSWDYPSADSAQAAAIYSCGWTSCKVLTTFTECGAVAENSDRYQGGSGPTLIAAQDSALSQLRGGGGWISAWACN